MPEIALRAKNGLRRDQNADGKARQLRAIVNFGETSQFANECVVADAVIIEPVSTPQFPANREKNREFFDFVLVTRSRRPANLMIMGLF